MTHAEMIETLRDVARNVGDIDRAKIEAVIESLRNESMGPICGRRDSGAGLIDGVILPDTEIKP